MLITSLIPLFMEKGPIWIISMLNRSQFYICPVCGYPELDEAAYDDFGCASYNICPCCGTEFGYDDSTVAHAELRKKWILKGMLWWSKNQHQPKDWDAIKQVEKVGNSTT